VKRLKTLISPEQLKLLAANKDKLPPEIRAKIGKRFGIMAHGLNR
jgi:hypothetical protein